MNKNIFIVFGTAVVIVILIFVFWGSQNEPLPPSQDLAGTSLSDAAKKSDSDQNQHANSTPQMSGKDVMQPPSDDEIAAAKAKKTMNATIKTSLGEISVELYGDKAPKTVANFVKLAGANFYDGIKFHRVIKGFMIQAGDPLTKDDSMKDRWGTGGPGYQFADEPFTGQYTRGTLAMANSGPNTNGSQFFIMHADTPLPQSYVIFGKVASGLDVVDKIANLPIDPGNDRPLTPPVIESITVAN
jgi:cyclophilin family peptidyl-prolyl cis-trans isomerase